MGQVRPLFARSDIHVHTRLSPCGQDEMTPGAIIRAAAEQGIEYLGISDHIHPFTDHSILDSVREECRAAPDSIRVFVGCEADIMAVGETVLDTALAAKADFVMVAANHFQDPSVSRPAAGGMRAVARHFLDMFTYAASLELADVIAHPFFVMPDTYDPLAPAAITEDELRPAVELAAKNHIAVEISRRALTPEQKPFLINFYRVCKQAGLMFAIGSDAHRLADVGRTYLVEQLIVELGLKDEDIWLPRGGALS